MYQKGETKTEKDFKMKKNSPCPQYRYERIIRRGKVSVHGTRLNVFTGTDQVISAEQIFH